MHELAGSVVVITGASRGIGAATARAFAAIGCHLVLAARSSQEISKLAAELQSEWRIRTLAVATDVTDPAQVNALMSAANREMGGIDILVNNAGLGSRGMVATVTEAEMNSLFEVNVFGAVRSMQAALPYLQQRGGGVVINIGSIVSYFALPADGKSAVSSTYCASKFALRAYTTAARAELMEANVHAILAVVGLTKTEFQENAFGDPDGTEATGPMGNSFLAVLKVLAVSPDKVAQRLIKAVQDKENEVFVSWWDQLLVQSVVQVPMLDDFIGRMYLALGGRSSVWSLLKARDFVAAGVFLMLLKYGLRLVFRRRRVS